ncbi:MAG: response regulator transcription factor [Spirochaetales bacterium]|nr:response regulator transcription factor [Spirochaetales bacterium]
MSLAQNIGFIFTNQTQGERVKYHFSKRNDINMVLSEKPDLNQDLDAIIIPNTMMNEFMAKSELTIKWLPVIIYGKPFFIRQAFLLGCADYLKDPWEMDELEARLDRVLKKQQQSFERPWGHLNFHKQLLILETDDNTHQIELSYQEYLILKTLLYYKDETVPREVLFYRIGRPENYGSSRVIDVHISAIRRKIEPLINPTEPIIRSVRGIGYLLE